MHSSAEHVLNLMVGIRAPFASSVLCIKIVRTIHINNPSALRKSWKVMLFVIDKAGTGPNVKDRMVKEHVSVGAFQSLY